ncbi:MAG: hypothetical protein R2877_01295 [Bdellovibrionota bacterium]
MEPPQVFYRWFSVRTERSKQSNIRNTTTDHNTIQFPATQTFRDYVAEQAANETAKL